MFSDYQSLCELRAAAQLVVDNWEKPDLALFMNDLRKLLEELDAEEAAEDDAEDDDAA